MSLDLNFMYQIETYGDADIEYIDISDTWHTDQVNTHLNITHNLGEMAGHVILNETDLYTLLWRPYRIFNILDDTEESCYFMPKASELQTELEVGINELKKNPNKYKKYSPNNGWGSYDGLVKFCEKYLIGIKRYPNARIEVSR